MSTHNICFHGEIRKICGYPLLSVAMIGTPYLLAILVLKVEIVHSPTCVMCLKYCCMYDTVDPDQTLHPVASDLGLHCL